MRNYGNNYEVVPYGEHSRGRFWCIRCRTTGRIERDGYWSRRSAREGALCLELGTRDPYYD